MSSLGFESKSQTFFQAINDLDADGVKAITFDEFFYLLTARTGEKNNRENLRKVYAFFDDERTGFLSVKNLRKITK